MPTMKVSVPTSMRKFVEEETARGGYSSADDYVAAMLKAERKRKASEKLNALLREGVESGFTELTAQDWVELKAEVKEVARKVRARHASRR